MRRAPIVAVRGAKGRGAACVARPSGMTRSARAVTVCQAHQPTPPLPGSTRKHLKRPGGATPKRLVAQRLLEAVCERGALHAAAVEHLRGATVSEEQLLLRFPSVEFRSLCLNPLAKSELMHAFPLDRGMWNRHKLQLAALLLELAGRGPGYEGHLEALVAATLERECCTLRKNKQVLAEEKEKQRVRLEARRAKLLTQLDAWCQATVSNPNFQLLRPVLKQVLEVEPAPQVDNKRDGQRTELEVSALLERELPPGWTLHTQARLVCVDGCSFRNEKMVKGEADILLVDQYGIVQAILEIKTAKGNPYLALYEDLQRFQNMVERVRGRMVAFVPSTPVPGGPSVSVSSVACGTPSSSSTSSDGVAAVISSSASSETGAAAGVGVGELPGTPSTTVLAPPAPVTTPADECSSHQSPVVTLRFSKNVKPIYVLGSAIAPEELGAVVRSAQSKLLTMEFGRVLSTQIDAWRQVSLVEINREAAVLQVPQGSFPQCSDNVLNYFRNLSWCDIFMVAT